MYRLLRYDENQKWIMNGNIYKLKILFRCDNKKNKKIRSIIVLFALSRFMTIQVNQEEDDANERRVQKRKRKENEPKIRRKWQAGWSSVVTWPEVAFSPPFNSTFDVETCTRSPLFPSSGFIRLAMGIKFRPL